MTHEAWEWYMALSRKVESGGRNSDGHEEPAIIDEQRRFIATFGLHLPPTQPDGTPSRVLAPGAISEALLLAEAGYDVYAPLLGPDNIRWVEERKHRLPNPGLVHPIEHDAHILKGTYPDDFFHGYFTVQVNEHWWAPLIHIGEVRFAMKADAVLFVDACGTTNVACECIWHTNLVPEITVRKQWEWWGFYPIWSGTSGDERPQFIFKIHPWGHPDFKNSGYLDWTRRLRAGERIHYERNCPGCR